MTAGGPAQRSELPVFIAFQKRHPRVPGRRGGGLRHHHLPRRGDPDHPVPAVPETGAEGAGDRVRLAGHCRPSCRPANANLVKMGACSGPSSPSGSPFTGFPLFFMIVTSLKPVEEINRMAADLLAYWRRPAAAEPTHGIFADPGSLKSLVADSLIVSSANTVLSLFLGTLAGYALARWVRGAGRREPGLLHPVQPDVPAGRHPDPDVLPVRRHALGHRQLPVADHPLPGLQHATGDLADDGVLPRRAARAGGGRLSGRLHAAEGVLQGDPAAGVPGHDLGRHAVLDLRLERIPVRQPLDRHHGQDLPGASSRPSPSAARPCGTW